MRDIAHEENIRWSNRYFKLYYKLTLNTSYNPSIYTNYT